MCCIDGCNKKEYYVDDDNNLYCRKHGVRFREINPRKIKVCQHDVYRAHWNSVYVEQQINKENRTVDIIRSKERFVSGYIPVESESMIRYWTSQYYNVNHVIS